MYNLCATLTGVIISVMVVANGATTAQYGLYSATVIIHLTGLLLVSGILLFQRKNPLPREKLPLWYFAGGAVGVGTTVFNAFAFGRISVSAIVALSLLGQAITAIVIDQWGLMGMEKRPLNPPKLVGLAVVACGICFMIVPTGGGAALPVAASLLSGLTIVLSRTVNAGLAEKTGAYQGTFVNFVVGLGLSLLVLVLFGRGEPMMTHFVLSPNLLLYTGGIFGVIVTVLCNVTVKKISSFYMTLFLFIGQVSAGIVSDIILTGAFSPKNLIGGLFVGAGLTLNLLLERRSHGPRKLRKPR